MKKTLGLSVAALTAALLATQASAREEIRIVGSSTVYPFSTLAAEQFGKASAFATPVVESTGSGGGIKRFCDGVGENTPDIANSSRLIKKSELEGCIANGVDTVIEAVVGFDGIVVANAKSAAKFTLTRAQLYSALHKGATATMWNEIDPTLPAQKIEVLGPPPTSGTRDAFEELVMLEGCLEAGVDKDVCKKEGAHIRDDGAYIESGENDNLIVSKLEANSNALGVFGYSFLEENASQIKGAAIDGVEPEFEAIADGSYPVSRKLYFYIKGQHVGVIPGLMEYALAFMSDAAIGEDGYAVEKGLIPLPEDQIEAMRASVTALTPLTPATY